jgi:type VI secretion system protein ImpK
LQDELFGGHMAGEWFFQHIEQLLARLDSPALADVLEVYELVLLLGFRGRYGAGDPAALHAIGARVGERIARIRGGAGPAGVAAGDLVAGWRPPDDVVAGGDPWVRRLSIGLAASVAVLVLLWVGGYASLGGSVDELRSIVPAAAR